MRALLHICRPQLCDIGVWRPATRRSIQKTVRATLAFEQRRAQTADVRVFFYGKERPLASSAVAVDGGDV